MTFPGGRPPMPGDRTGRLEVTDELRAAAAEELAAAGCFLADHGADPLPCAGHLRWGEAMVMAIEARRRGGQT